MSQYFEYHIKENQKGGFFPKGKFSGWTFSAEFFPGIFFSRTLKKKVKCIVEIRITYSESDEK